ncbi:MAG TPA: flagellar protein FliT [Desulfotomaculum sp.]|nr:flagellar protein FliT [Desulfotomaculum sp.]
MKMHGQNDYPSCAGVGCGGFTPHNAAGERGQQPEHPVFHRPGCLTIESAAGDGGHPAARKLALLREYRAMTEGLIAALHTSRGRETGASPTVPAGAAMERQNTAPESNPTCIVRETVPGRHNNPAFIRDNPESAGGDKMDYSLTVLTGGSENNPESPETRGEVEHRTAPAREDNNPESPEAKSEVERRMAASCGDKNPESLEQELLTRVGQLLAARQEIIRQIDELDRQLTASAAPLLGAVETRSALQEIRALEKQSRHLMDCHLQELRNKIVRLQAGRRALEYMKVMAAGAGKLDASR